MIHLARQKNSTDEPASIVVGGIMLGIGITIFLGIIGTLIYSHRHGDKDGDGLGDDNMPATQAQIAIISNGMRDLGEFWTPTRMNQAQAREMINTINQRLQKK